MSDIEAETIPVLKPLILDPFAVSQLSHLDRCKLAVWVTLRSMVMESLRPQGRAGYYAQSERVAFQSNPEVLVPHLNTMIWITPYIDRPWETNIDVINHFDSTEGVGFHVTTGFVHQIAFTLTTSKGFRRRLSLAKMNADGWNKGGS